jgi:hypothetical protein
VSKQPPTFKTKARTARSKSKHMTSDEKTEFFVQKQPNSSNAMMQQHSKTKNNNQHKRRVS